MRQVTILIAALAYAGAMTLAGCGRDEEPSFRPSRARADDQPRRPAPAASPGEPGAAAEARTPEGLEEAGPSVTEVDGADPRLLNPAGATERAPDLYVVELDTTEGPIRIEVHRDWAPHGADRFWNLVRIGYYTDIAFFRVIDGFMAQAGIHGRPDVNAAWRGANIPDDPVVQHNTPGMVSYAMAGPGTRTTQFFINLVDNSRLDAMGFAPFGRVLDMTAVRRLYSGYGEGAPGGRGPSQARIQREGNAYLRAEFPELDYIRSARIVSPSGEAASGGSGRPRGARTGR